jgi:hypothetical protein
MKKLILFAAIISATVLTSFAQNNFYGNSYGYNNATYSYTPASTGSYYSTPVHVDSYIKSNGTVVNSYYRTAPDNTKSNNWSTYPNVNPYTGKTGTIKQW